MAGEEINTASRPAAISTNNTNGQSNATSSSTSNTARPNPSLDRASNNNAPKTGVVQPKPQALPKRSGPASIIVSPRQKGNPVLTNIKSMPWEYGDIPADYVLGLTTCALFLSLKYHRLHPEYIYTRIKNLQGRYALRIVLTMVDIPNHEEALKELSKTSLINNVTLILCWSSLEGARYLELFKTYENAAPTSIRQHQSNKYSDRMIDFITTPRSINKTDAVSLVSQFGSLRTAVNARHEDVGGIAGWGEKKVQRWCATVREPFRTKRATKRRALGREESGGSGLFVGSLSRDVTMEEGGSPAVDEGEERRGSTPAATGSRPGTAAASMSDADRRPSTRLAEEVAMDDGAFAEDEVALEEAMTAAPIPPKKAPAQEVPQKRKPEDDPLSDGVMAALSKLRKDGG